MKLSQTSDPRDHYVELDALRGAAILTVVLTHASGSWLRQTGIPLTVPLLGADLSDLLLFIGPHALTLFFLLSGYLLTWTEGKRAKHGTYSVRSYALRRIFRLAPAYYAAILIAIIVMQPRHLSVADVLTHVSFIHGLDIYTTRSIDPVWWSLTPEIIFYCLLPFVVLKLPRLSQRLALFGVFALASLTIRVYYATGLTENNDWLNVWISALFIITLLYVFMMGVLLRMLVEYLNDQPAASRQRPRLATALFLVSVVGMVAVCPIGTEYIDSSSWRLLEMVTQPIVIAFFVSVLLGSPLLGAILKWRFLAFVGMISYSLFLLHNTLLRTVSQHFLADIGKRVVEQGSFVAWATFLGYALVILAGACAIAYLGYRYIESPFIRLGRALPVSGASLLPKALRGGTQGKGQK